MDDLLHLEEIYNFNEFTNEDALRFGMNAVQLVQRGKLKNIRIRVKYHGDIVFQYLMEGKVGVIWLDRKENVVLESKHSSLYVYKNQELYQQMQGNDKYAVCGGGFPIIVNGEVVGAFCISGLSHQEDHDLIIKVLEKMKESDENL